MSPDISLKSLKFSTKTGLETNPGNAQVTLTDGSQSPYFGYDLLLDDDSASDSDCDDDCFERTYTETDISSFEPFGF